MAASPAAISTIAKPAHIQMYEAMIDHVTRVGPSRVTPLKGGAKFDSGRRRLYEPAVRSSKTKEPLSSVLVDPTTWPFCTAWTLTPGRPFSLGSTAFGCPAPPGAQSSHTTPRRPEPLTDVAAGAASLGTLFCGSPTRPSGTG